MFSPYRFDENAHFVNGLPYVETDKFTQPWGYTNENEYNSPNILCYRINYKKNRWANE